MERLLKEIELCECGTVRQVVERLTKSGALNSAILRALSVLRRLGGRLELGHERRCVGFTEAASIC